MMCPVWVNAMSPMSEAGTKLLYCRECNHVWVEGEQLAELLSGHTAKAFELDELEQWRLAKPPLGCPHCSTMTLSQFASNREAGKSFCVCTTCNGVLVASSQFDDLQTDDQGTPSATSHAIDLLVQLLAGI